MTPPAPRLLSLISNAAAALLCVLLICCIRPAAADDDALRLNAQQDAIAPHVLHTWLDPRGLSTIADAAAAGVPYRTVGAGSMHALRPGAALWLRLRLQRSASGPATWMLDLPLPTLDRATLYTRAADGTWRSAQAGDHVPLSRWMRPGRYPQFALTLPTTAATDVYLRIEHGRATPVPLRLSTEAHAQGRAMLEYLALGLVFGGLLLVVLGACWRAWWLRDRGYAWFAAFGASAIVGVGAYTGIASHLLWGEWPAWSDAAPGVTCMLSGGLALAVVAQLTALASRGRVLARALWACAAAAPLLALAYAAGLPREHGVVLLGIYLAGVALLSFGAGIAAWRRGDQTGRWLMAGALPLTAAVVLALARQFGWIAGTWMIEYAAIAALAWDLPLLKAALDSRTFERRSARLRQQALASHDPLTGLLRAAPFRAHLDSAIERQRRTGEPASLVAVQVRNLGEIAAQRGSEAAEECLLRAVLKLQSLVRDVDIIARVGDATFGILFEGLSGRRSMSAFASHLIASGLIEDSDHPNDPPLKFHIAIALLPEQPGANTLLLDQLLRMLAGMATRTRRPIRYLSPPGAPPESRPFSELSWPSPLPTPSSQPATAGRPAQPASEST